MAFFHQPLYLFQMADRPGQAVYNRLLILVNMSVAVDNALGVLVHMLQKI